jgi:hypothetical protein
MEFCGIMTAEGRSSEKKFSCLIFFRFFHSYREAGRNYNLGIY